MAEDTIDKHDLKKLIEWLKTDPWLSQGQLVKEFERKWASWLGVPFAVFVNSGSSANLLMYYALMLSGKLKNKKVIVPAVSWPTTVAPAIQLGFEPILCEAEPRTLGLDPDFLEHLLKKHNPSTVVICHVLGVPNEMDAIMKLKVKYGFFLLEDACAATGSQYEGRRVGTFGDMSTFSFFYGHHLSTIEGGMICTGNEAFYDILLQVRSHGWARDLPFNKAEEKAKEYHVIEFNKPFTFYYPGFNLRSTDLNAKIGLLQLEKIDHVVSRRIANHQRYQKRFSQAEGFEFQVNERATICSIAFLALASSASHREEIARKLKKENIETRPYGGGNMSRQPFWAKRYGTMELPVADKVYFTAFQLPNHAHLSEEDIDFIGDVVISQKEKGSSL